MATDQNKSLSKGAQTGIIIAAVLLGPPLAIGVMVLFFWIVHKIRGR